MPEQLTALQADVLRGPFPLAIIAVQRVSKSCNTPLS
jgi:hypothetical protein